ncbi:MAG: tRNA dihydrouridine synthase DusB [candidate division Zixibacteria bacterium]|nr:tRNA dihydrouridine synthase DusB [candidate division Zixibacteria bacterium]
MLTNFKVSGKVISAPAAGVTDSITRRLAREYGAEITVSELVSAEGLIRNHDKTKGLLRFTTDERPIGLQLFGADPGHMAEAARYAASLEPDFIDLNFGCPARKVVGKNGGSSLLLNLSLIEKIIDQTVKAVPIPVTIKYRSGWDNKHIVAVEVAQIAESCGASAVCLHPRTRVQGFSGYADWSLIAKVKQAVKIPVIGSGDIDSPVKAVRMFNETGCDAIMICRASFGNPWIFHRIKHYLTAGIELPEPTPAERINLAIRHLRMSIASYGSPRGIFSMRAKLAWYLRGLPKASKIRTDLMKLTDEYAIVKLLSDFAMNFSNGFDTIPDNRKTIAS